MSRRIKEIIYNSKDALYDLSAYLKTTKNVDNTWREIKALVFSGNEVERMTCLTLLSVENPDLIKDDILE